jgi:hypothetical protein
VNDDPIRRFLRARGAGGHVVDGGLAGLVDAWEQTADQIEVGYPLTLDDYLNDLDARQLIELALRSMPEPRGSLLARLRRADARVRAGSVPVPRSVWGEEHRADARSWWYFRVPRAPGPDLAEDLAREGLSPGNG